MLITRKSPRRNDENPFRSRFDEFDAFPMRQYLRTRDELVQKLIMATIQICFSIALFIFAQRVYQAFVRHGMGVAGWVRWGAISLVTLFALTMLGRSIQNLRSSLELRGEMQVYRKKSHSLKR